MSRLNVLLAGVGGQGLITLASVMAKAGVVEGTKVLVAETHGLSQRGGSVEVHVRFGRVESPLIPPGGAHVVVALEAIEALRSLKYMNHSTLVLVNRRVIRPNLPGVKAPSLEEILEELGKAGVKVLDIPATDLAIKAGSSLATNMVMLGALLATGALDGYISRASVEKVLETMPSRWRGVNLEALKLGYSAVGETGD